MRKLPQYDIIEIINKDIKNPEQLDILKAGNILRKHELQNIIPEEKSSKKKSKRRY